MMQGQCLCGDVTVAVTQAEKTVSACHCRMCQAWVGSAFTAIHAKAQNAVFEGPVKTRDTSDWARRGWCDACGSALFYQEKTSGGYGISSGLFPDAIARPVTLEYYSEHTAHGMTFAGDHPRLTTSQTLAHFGAPQGDH